MNHAIPPILFKKIWLTGLIGAGCMLFGTVYFFKTGDRILLVLSLLVFLCCIGKAISILRLAKKQRYEMVEGTCIGITQKPFEKTQIVRLMDNEGIESTLRLPKGCKIKIGGQYRFYFSQQNSSWTGSRYLDMALMADGFLGYEHIADETPPVSF